MWYLFRLNLWVERIINLKLYVFMLCFILGCPSFIIQSYTEFIINIYKMKVLINCAKAYIAK